MALRWAPGMARSQLIRRAARILAFHRAVEASRPHDWNIQTLAAKLMVELDGQGISVGVDGLVIRSRTVHHFDIDSQSQTATMTQPFLVTVHVVRRAPGAACVHPKRTPASAENKGESNLLNDPWFWTNPEAHTHLQHFLRLDGMAASGHLEGPWQHHDPRRAAPLRAALAALACERAYGEEMFLNNPAILTVGRMNRIGQTLGELFIEPWRKKFEDSIRAEQEVAVGQGVTKVWRFIRPDEEQWSLELCWAIVKESHRARLDCPPLVLPLEVIRQRGELSPIQAILAFLVDDPRGPRIKATNAARHVGLGEHAAHELLSQGRKKRPRLANDSQHEPLWDPFPNRHGIMFPMAFRPSHSGMTSGEQGRDDTSTELKRR